MKIRANLVYDKVTGELKGFVALGDPDVNFSTLVEVNELATHALVFIVQGLATDLWYSLAYFGTTGIMSYQFLPLFWEAVSISYLTCNLWVITTACDGASPNKRFFRLHKDTDGDAGKDVTHRTINFFPPDRFIYFLSDPQHLMKTARNYLYNSCFSQATRYMWNGGKYVVWQYIIQIYNEDQENGLKILPIITSDHVKLTSYSVMNNLAAQVLSPTMSSVLTQFGPPEVSATAEYCKMIDQFFDCLNVRSLDEHLRKRKPLLALFTSIEDNRFQFLENEFLGYFRDWKESIANRQGEFTANAHAKMFVSWQTHEGLQITVHSIKELVKYLLHEGIEYVLTEKFCQDSCEEYFGNKRSMGRRCDNPDLQAFGYDDNTIIIQRHISQNTGNTRGRHKKDSNNKWVNVIEDILPKRKPTRKVLTCQN